MNFTKQIFLPILFVLLYANFAFGNNSNDNKTCDKTYHISIDSDIYDTRHRIYCNRYRSVLGAEILITKERFNLLVKYFIKTGMTEENACKLLKNIIERTNNELRKCGLGIQWNCPECTFLNEFTHTKCEVCGTNRPAFLLTNIQY